MLLEQAGGGGRGAGEGDDEEEDDDDRSGFGGSGNEEEGEEEEEAIDEALMNLIVRRSVCGVIWLQPRPAHRNVAGHVFSLA